MSRTIPANAFTQIREGATLDDVFANSYESHSGFRKAFKAFGVPPGVSQTSDFIATQILETPLGALLVGADSKGVCLIEYTDMRMLHNYAMIRKHCYPVLPVTNEHIERLRDAQRHKPTAIRAVASKWYESDQYSHSMPSCDWKDAIDRLRWRTLAKRLLLKLERTGKLPGKETIPVCRERLITIDERRVKAVHFAIHSSFMGRKKDCQSLIFFKDMSSNRIEDIYNFLKLSDTIATAGQPTEEQFLSNQRGYQVVVNLAFSQCVARWKESWSSRQYAQIPVVWDNPTLEDVAQFSAWWKRSLTKLFLSTVLPIWEFQPS